MKEIKKKERREKRIVLRKQKIIERGNVSEKEEQADQEERGLKIGNEKAEKMKEQRIFKIVVKMIINAY